jgi:uncharacterized protein YfaT (DUF1175 family)
MATRGRKYSAAAPLHIVEATEEQRAADGKQTQKEINRERAVFRGNLIMRAGQAMMRDPDPTWKHVSAWLRQAYLAAEAARLHPGDSVLPDGQIDHALRISEAYLRIHGG